MSQRFSEAGRTWDHTSPHWGEEDEEDRDVLKIAGFCVGDGVYGVDMMRIKEVIQAKPHTVHPIPRAPDSIDGVIELRGVILPIMDLRKRFGVEIDPLLERLNKLIIVAVYGRILGLRVDRVLGELRVPQSAVNPAPALATGLPSDASVEFSGVCKSGERIVFLLDLESLARAPSEMSEVSDG
ncbi:MAG: hypothetical protein B7733_18465 [Myxococcales bacterium FL481]|nr:MAG: hypothetical protein B7733_18465 [Myxococcales bacterium FL481]